MLTPPEKKNTFIIVIVFSLLHIIFLFPYLLTSNQRIIGYDAGFYINEINRYLENIESLETHISVWHEPLGILSTATFFQITNLTPYPDIKIYVYIILILKSYIIFALGAKILRGRSRKIILITFVILSNLYINSFYLFIYRQFWADFLLMIFIYIFLFKNKKNINTILLCGTLVGAIYMAHRGVSFVLALFLFFNTVHFLIKKRFNDIGRIILMLCIGLIWSMPFFIISLGWNMHIISDFSKSTVESSSQTYAAGNQGVSVFTGEQNAYGTETWKIFIYESIIYILIIPVISHLLQLKKGIGKIFIIIAIPLYLIVASKGSFSQRILYYLIIILYFIYTQVSQKKIIQIITLFSVLIMIVPYIGTKKAGLIDPAYLQFLKQFNKKQTVFVLTGSSGVMINQLGWQTAVTRSHFADTRYVGDVRTFGKINHKEFYQKGYNQPFPVYSEKEKIYVVLPLNAPIKEWEKSIFYQRIPSPCNRKNLQTFCYVFKYIGPLQKPETTSEEDYWGEWVGQEELGGNE